MITVSKDQQLIGSIGGGSRATYIDVTTDYTAKCNDAIYVNTENNAITITLPDTPTDNCSISIIDNKSTFDVNAVIVARNGETIMGLAEDMVINTKNASIELVYNTTDWRLV